jgi:hypothetical protein
MIFGWVVFSLTRFIRKITERLNERNPASKSKSSLEMRPETNPLISSIPEPPTTDLVYGDENPLPDCRRRIPKDTITDLDDMTDEHHESMEYLKKEITRLSKEIYELQSSVQLAAEERAKLEKTLMEQQTKIDTYEACTVGQDHYLVQQDYLVSNLSAENNELKTSLAESQKTLLEKIEKNTELDLSVQKLKEKITVLEGKVAWRESSIVNYREMLPKRSLPASETENEFWKNAKLNADKKKPKPVKHLKTLIDDAYDLLQEAIDLTIEDEEIETGTTRDTEQDKGCNLIKNVFVKKNEKPRITALAYSGTLMLDGSERLKELFKRMEVRGKELRKYKNA